MIVVISGMYRSGSTFSFNIVREIISYRGNVSAVYNDLLSNSLAASAEFEQLIIKCHSPDEIITGLISKKVFPCICTIRKPEDAIVSLMKAFGFEIDYGIDLVKAWLEWHQNVRDRVLNISYEQIDTDRLAAILKIQQYLNGSQDIDQARMLSEKYEKGKLKNQLDVLVRGNDTTDTGSSYYDNLTYFHRRHISSLVSISGIAQLSNVQIERIRHQLGRFIDDDGAYRFHVESASSKTYKSVL